MQNIKKELGLSEDVDIVDVGLGYMHTLVLTKPKEKIWLIKKNKQF